VKKQHQQVAAAKRKKNSGKPKDRKSNDLAPDDSRQLPESKAYSGCHKCGSSQHHGRECKKRKANSDPKNKDKGNKRDWRDYFNDESDNEK
jgi:hypothetical protein